ncbi:MAG: preprotein translocase subunit YajC [Leptothrix ochracea]|uniref:preprotein translocase subunit YajC n=1 Tax=Leptothrix ochracea TaxID=735331 RepID=UPI0034E26ECB
MFISNAYAQAAETAQAAGPLGQIQSFLPLIMMFVVLYFVMIRPQMKRQKEHKAMVEGLARGDEVVTSGGLLGKITKVNDNHISLEVASGVEVICQRISITMVLPKGTIK